MADLFRSVVVDYHFGDAGSGKSHHAVSLADSDFAFALPFGLSGPDWSAYSGESVLVLDDFMGPASGVSWHEFLSWLDGSPLLLPGGVSAAWTRVSVHSVLAPEELYDFGEGVSLLARSCFSQLQRRLTSVVYHFHEVEFGSFSLSGCEYEDRSLLLVEQEKWLLDFDDEEPF